MNLPILINLHNEGLITDESFERIKQHRESQVVFVHWELRLLLFVGITMLTGGLGVLVYKNIDTIGHQFILLFIAVICCGCFFLLF